MGDFIDKARRLMLIRLFQQATMDSMAACLGQHFRRICVNSSRSLRPNRRADSIWLLVAGRMGSCACDAGAGGPMNWQNEGTGSVPPVGAKFR
jgi:hypothetical protein